MNNTVNPSAVDMYVQRSGSANSPVNPITQGADFNNPEGLAKFFASMLGTTNPSVPKVGGDEPQPNRYKGAEWLYDEPEAPKPKPTGVEAPTKPQPQSGVGDAYKAKSFQPTEFQFFGKELTPDALSATIAEMYKGNQIPTPTLDDQSIEKLRAGDYSPLQDFVRSAQQAAHTQAMVGLLHMLPSLLNTHLGSMFSDYQTHTEFAKAHREGVGSQQDPIMAMLADAAMTKYRTKYPNATADQLVNAANQIKTLLEERLAKPAAKPKAPEPQIVWDDFLN